MQRLYGSPCCGPALKRRAALVTQPPENRRAFRHESVVPQRILVAIACPTSIALPKQRAPTKVICLRDNQKACQDSLLHQLPGLSVKRYLTLGSGTGALKISAKASRQSCLHAIAK